VVAAGVPGVIVLVRDARRTVRVAGGSARLKPRRAMRVDDRFRIGSLTKTYVATVVLQLVGEGKLSLDDSAERLLPGMVPNGQSISVRQLLNHHSGLFDFFNDPQHLATSPRVALVAHWDSARALSPDRSCSSRAEAPHEPTWTLGPASEQQMLDRSPIDRSAAGRAKQERHPHVCGYSVPMDVAALAKGVPSIRLNHSIVV
jgi:CubicO group peptidase (beta-lactamase class C family)